MQRVGYRSWVIVKASKRHRLRVIEEVKEKDKVRKRRRIWDGEHC